MSGAVNRLCVVVEDVPDGYRVTRHEVDAVGEGENLGRAIEAFGAALARERYEADAREATADD